MTEPSPMEFVKTGPFVGSPGSGAGGGRTCAFSLGTTKGSTRVGGKMVGAKGKGKAFKKTTGSHGAIHSSLGATENTSQSVPIASTWCPPAATDGGIDGESTFNTTTKTTTTSVPSPLHESHPVNGIPSPDCNATKASRMSVGSTDNEMEDGYISPSCVPSGRGTGQGTRRDGGSREQAPSFGPFTSNTDQVGTKKVAPDASLGGSKTFSLFKKTGDGEAGGGASVSQKKKSSGVSARKRKGFGKHGVSAGVKELDELFANIRVDRPQSPSVEVDGRGCGQEEGRGRECEEPTSSTDHVNDSEPDNYDNGDDGDNTSNETPATDPAPIEVTLSSSLILSLCSCGFVMDMDI